MQAERQGNAIFLNGTSSSGKTTIAKELQRALEKPYLHLSVDTYLHQLPDAVLQDNQRFMQELLYLLAGFNASCAAITRAGNNIIVDHVLQEPSWVLPCAEAFEGIPVVFVAVRCPLAVLEAREQARSDRHIGTARYQYERVHTHGLYDVEVDTSTMPVKECGAIIGDYVRSGNQPSAFEALRARM